VKQPSGQRFLDGIGRKGSGVFSGSAFPMWPPSAERGCRRVPLGARDPHNRWPKTIPDPRCVLTLHWKPRSRDAKGVGLQSPRSRYSAHLGLPRFTRVPPNPNGVLHANPGCAARPWAMEWHPVGVRCHSPARPKVSNLAGDLRRQFRRGQRPAPSTVNTFADPQAMIWRIGVTCSTPTSFWSRPP